MAGLFDAYHLPDEAGKLLRGLILVFHYLLNGILNLLKVCISVLLLSHDMEAYHTEIGFKIIPESYQYAPRLPVLAFI